MKNENIQPVTIERLHDSVYASFALLAAMQLDLFTGLSGHERTSNQLASSMGVNPEKLPPLLYALVSISLLCAEDGRFSNSDEAERYLVRGRETFIGDRHLLWSELWQAAMQTAETVRTGEPSTERNFSTMSTEEQTPYFNGLHPRAVATGKAFATSHDLSPYHSILDIGGGSGGFAIGMAQICAGLRITVADVPSVIPIARRFISEAGLVDRIDLLPVDVLREELQGSYDVVILKNILQVFSSEEAQRALRNVRNALAPGGHIFIMGDILEDSRISPRDTATFNLAFINIYKSGQTYTRGEYRSWLSGAGFTEVTFLSEETITAISPA